MNKGRVIGLLKQHGDAILTIKDPKPPFIKYNLCTLDFKNTYIKSQTKGKKPWPKNKTDIVVYDWTDNRYLIIHPVDIVHLQPLSEVLKNTGNPLRKE
jgi:hypothetical protein